MRNIPFDECDSFDEVCAWFNKVFARIEEFDKRIGELEALKPREPAEPKDKPDEPKSKKKTPKKAKPKAKPKPKAKKKGSIKTRLLVSLVVLVIATFCYGAYVTTDINYEIASNAEMLSQYLRDSFSNITSETYLFTPGSQPSTADTVQGKVYFDSSASLLYISLDGTNWTSIDTGAVSGYSLDASYNEGYAIDVDGTAVTLTVSDDDNNGNLILTNNDATNDPAALVINMASSQHGIALDIDAQTSGYDIKGTGDSFTVTGAGIVDLVGLTIGAEDLELENGAEIQNVTNTEIKFIEDDGSGDEDFSIDFQNDALVLKSGSSVASLDFGPIDDLIGVGTIVFDDAASTITVTGTTNTYDLTVSQAGTIDVSLILQSAGSIDDALSLITSDSVGVMKMASAYKIDIDAADDINIDISGSGKDVRIDSAAGSVYIEAAESATNAIQILATAGGIDLTATSGGSGEDIDITATGGSVNIIANENDADAITIATSGGGGTSEAINILNDTGTGVASIDFDSTAGGMDIDVALSYTLSSSENTADAIYLNASAGGIDLTAAGSSTEDIDIVCTSGSTNISGGEDIATAVVISAGTGGIDITADGDPAKDLDLVCTNGSTNISGGEADAAAVTIAAGAGGIDITSAATFDIDITATGGTVQVITSEAAANQFKVDAQGTIADASGDAIVFETTNGGILLNADHADNGDIGFEAGDDLRLTSTGDMILTIGGHARIVDDDLLSFGETDNITINYDEDGDDNLQIIGPVDFETTYVEFRSNPVGMQNDGTVWSGTNTETNSFVVDGVSFEQYVIGSVGAPVPVMTDDGLNVRGDEADNEGFEYGFGITSRNPHAYTSNTHSVYNRIKFKLETVAEMDEVAVGWRLKASYNVDIHAYDTYVGLTVNNGTINTIEDLNGGAASEDDSGDTWADGATHTLEVRIDGDGDTTWWVDGSAISNQGSLAFDWSDNETIIPFFHILGDNAAGCEVELITWECGIYTQ